MHPPFLVFFLLAMLIMAQSKYCLWKRSALKRLRMVLWSMPASITRSKRNICGQNSGLIGLAIVVLEVGLGRSLNWCKAVEMH
jgi:hypothetical protein